MTLALVKQSNKEPEAVLLARQEEEELDKIWGESICTDSLPDKPQPIRWMVKDVIAQGLVIAVHAPPGGYKSMALMDLAVCVATGKPWLPPLDPDSGLLGFDVPEPRNVLWIDQDQGRAAIEERLIAMTAVKGRGPCRVECKSFPHKPLDLTTSDRVEALARLVKHGDFGLVIIDALANVVGDTDLSKADTSTAIAGASRVREDTGATVVLIHHNNRSDSIFGSVMIQAGLDLALGFTTKHEKDRDVIAVQTTKARRYTVEPFSFVVESRRDEEGVSVELECRLHSMGKATGAESGRDRDRADLARLEAFVRGECAKGRRPIGKECIEALGGEGHRANRLLKEARNGPDAFLDCEKDGRCLRYSIKEGR